MTLTTADLDRLEALERAATAAPWRTGSARIGCAREHRHQWGPACTYTVIAWEEGAGVVSKDIPLGAPADTVEGVIGCGEDNCIVPEDAAFLIALRNAAPALLRDLREARALLAALVAVDPLEELDVLYYRCRSCGASAFYPEELHRKDCPYARARAFLVAAGVEVE